MYFRNISPFPAPPTSSLLDTANLHLYRKSRRNNETHLGTVCESTQGDLGVVEGWGFSGVSLVEKILH